VQKQLEAKDMGKDTLSDAQLKAIMPLCNPEKRKLYLPWLNLSMAYFEINTELRGAMYLAQLAHESTDLTHWEENLNYSAGRLTQVWPHRFPTLSAASPYAHNPIALANKTYGGRMGNRANSNDGWMYRGRGPIQITGKDLYQELTDALGADFNVDFVANPELLLSVQWGLMASAWVFAVNKKCLPLADNKNVRQCTIRINGGENGLASRLENYRRAVQVLPDTFNLKDYDTLKKDFGERLSTAGTSTVQPSRLDVSNQEVFQPVPDPSTDDAAAPATADTDTAAPAAPGGNGGAKPPPEPQVVYKEKASTFSRVLTAVFAFFSMVVTTLTGWCGSNEAVSAVSQRAAEHAVDGADQHLIIRLAMVAVYIVVFGGIGIVLAWIAFKIYDHEKNRATELNKQKIVAASDPEKATVEFTSKPAETTAAKRVDVTDAVVTSGG
jgi:putative chitinase